MLTVGLTTHTSETMTLHNALKTTPFGCTNHINEVAFAENISYLQGVAEVKRLFEFFEFDQLPFWGSVGRFEVTQHRLVSVLFFLFAVTQLNGFVAILVLCTDLGNDTGTSFDNCTCQSLPVRIVHTGHPDLFTN